MEEGQGKHPVDGLSDPHSLFIEILSQYGLPVTLLLVVLFVFILVKMTSATGKKLFTPEFFTLTLLIPCFILLSNANSTSLSLPLIWLMISLIILNFEQLIERKG